MKSFRIVLMYIITWSIIIFLGTSFLLADSIGPFPALFGIIIAILWFKGCNEEDIDKFLFINTFKSIEKKLGYDEGEE